MFVKVPDTSLLPAKTYSDIFAVIAHNDTHNLYLLRMTENSLGHTFYSPNQENAWWVPQSHCVVVENYVLNDLFKCVEQFSDPTLKMWGQYIWSKYWTLSYFPIKEKLVIYDRWEQVWEHAVKLWRMRHGNHSAIFSQAEYNPRKAWGIFEP